jgi:hypothetical protein
MKSIWLVLLLVSLAGCWATERPAEDATDSEKKAHAERIDRLEGAVRTIGGEVGMNPGMAGAVGSAITAFLGLAGSVVAERRKSSRKRAELHERINVVQSTVAEHEKHCPGGGGAPRIPS